MGDEAGEPRGGFVLFDQSLKLLQPWAPPERYAPFGYDFWYQPRQGVMVSSGWGAPAAFSRGFDPADVAKGRYASALYVWDWRSRELAQTLPLGADGAVPLEVRFLHEPDAAVGFVGAALASNVLRFRKTLPPEPGAPPQPQHAVGTWAAEVAIRQESVPVSGWALPSLPPLITDILISLDDRFLFLSNWLRGDVCMYDISEPLGEPRLVGQVWLGGVIRAGGGVTVTGGPLQGAQPSAPRIRGQELVGGPQMLQLRRAFALRRHLHASRPQPADACPCVPASPQPGWPPAVRDELTVQPLGCAVLPRVAPARQLAASAGCGHRARRPQPGHVTRDGPLRGLWRRAGRPRPGARDPLPRRRQHQRHLVLSEAAAAAAGSDCGDGEREHAAGAADAR
jgi:hypothetical protein